MCAWSAVSSSFSLPYASLRYWISFASRVDSSSAMDRPSVRARVRPYVPTLRLFKPVPAWRARIGPFLIALPCVNETKKDPMEVEAAIGALNVALRLQQRSALAYTHMAGTLVGF